MADAKPFPNIDQSEDDIRDYLNTLRDSGACNMFGAGPYLEQTFGLSRNDARAALVWWMGQY